MDRWWYDIIFRFEDVQVLLTCILRYIAHFRNKYINPSITNLSKNWCLTILANSVGASCCCSKVIVYPNVSKRKRRKKTNPRKNC